MTVNSDGVVLQIVGGPVNVTVMVLFCKLSLSECDCDGVVL